MDVIAYNAVGHKGIICAVLDARKNKVYACFYSSDGKKLKRLSKYLLLPLDELLKKSLEYDKVVFLGDMAEEGSFERSGLSRSQDQILLRKIWFPRAEVVAKLGAEQARLKKFVRPEDLEPMYIYSRECDITGK
jgi:tRNA threonylcarbamoyladenosine biosynthesis protein TsaB